MGSNGGDVPLGADVSRVEGEHASGSMLRCASYVAALGASWIAGAWPS